MSRLTLLLAVSACWVDQDREPWSMSEPMSPLVSIVSPEPDEVLLEPEHVLLRGRVENPYGLSGVTEVVWESSLDGILREHHPDDIDEGGRFGTTVAMSPGVHTLRLWAANSEGGRADRQLSITVIDPGPAPIVELLDPPTTTYVGTPAEFSAEFSAGEELDWLHWSAGRVTSDTSTTSVDVEGGDLDDSVEGLTHAVWTPPEPGRYRIRVAVSDVYGRGGRAEVEVTAKDP